MAGAGWPGASEVENAGWIDVLSLRSPGSLAEAQKHFSLGLGELSTILLAKEVGASMVLMDEESGRQLARTKGLEVRGTVGLLENLYQRREIPDLRQTFASLLLCGAQLEVGLLNRRLRHYGLPPL